MGRVGNVSSDLPGEAGRRGVRAARVRQEVAGDASRRPGARGRASARAAAGAEVTAAPRFASVWDAIADTPSQAANLRLRAELAHQVLVLVAARGWTQAEAARRAGVTAPRMSDLARGLLDKFSLDALVSMLEGMGASVQIKVKSPRREASRAAA